MSGIYFYAYLYFGNGLLEALWPVLLWSFVLGDVASKIE